MFHVLIGTDEQLFHFTMRWTRAPNINPYFLDNSRAITRLVRLCGAEQKGAAPMTIATIHPAIRVWLARKGFPDDKKIEELESKGPTLVHACLIISRFASRCPDGVQGYHHQYSRWPCRITKEGRAETIRVKTTNSCSSEALAALCLPNYPGDPFAELPVAAESSMEQLTTPKNYQAIAALIFIRETKDDEFEQWEHQR